MKIVVLDDDETIRETPRRMLTPHDHEEDLPRHLEFFSTIGAGQRRGRSERRSGPA